MEVTRRNFLKGSLTAAAATAAAGALAACSPSGSSSSDSSANANAASTEGMKHTWEVAPEPIKDVAETKDYDIVIVGAGIAGNSAAEAAACNGAKVAVIERTDGIQMHGIDVAAIGSKFKIDNGVDIDIDEACRLLYLWSQQTTNYNLIRTWAEKTGPVIDYIEGMMAEQGFKMVSALSKTAKYGWETLPERWRVYPDAVSFVSDAEPGAVRSDKKTCNWNLGEALYKSATDNGAEYVFNTHAEQLVGDAKSGITGVIVTDADGKYVQYNASKGVILATGDISGNQEMVNCWARITTRADGNVYTPEGGNTGDGILMGCWAGAALSKSPAAPMVHQYTLEHMMPKKWRNKWGALDDEAATRRDRKLLTLGNLAIITHSLNASIRDADWTTKKQGKGYKDGLALCAAGLATMAGALEKESWDEGGITDRAEWLANKALVVWR